MKFYKKKSSMVSLCLAVILILCGTAFADLTVDTEGKVGIGTEAPQAELDVKGKIRSSKDGYEFPDGTILESADRFGSPPLKFEVGIKNNTSTWDCECNVDLEDYCGDEDGCRIRLLMQHETDSYDKVKCIEEFIYMEQPDKSSKKYPGVYGWTRQMGGGDVAWIAGVNNKNYEIFGPWDWAYMYNYNHKYCPGQSGATGPTHTNPYEFTFMSHPHVLTTIFVYDN